MLRRSNQANWDGGSAGADNGVRAGGRRATPNNVEHRQVDVAEVRDTGSVLDLVNKRLHESDYGDAVRDARLKNRGVRGVNDRNRHNRTAGRNDVCILWAALG